MDHEFDHYSPEIRTIINTYHWRNPDALRIRTDEVDNIVERMNETHPRNPTRALDAIILMLNDLIRTRLRVFARGPDRQPSDPMPLVAVDAEGPHDDLDPMELVLQPGEQAHHVGEIARVLDTYHVAYPQLPRIQPHEVAMIFYAAVQRFPDDPRFAHQTGLLNLENYIDDLRLNRMSGPPLPIVPARPLHMINEDDAVYKDTLLTRMTCKVCLVHEADTRINCGHLFCHECIVQVNICPTCRTFILKRDNIYYSKYLKYKAKYIALRK